jgi:hypothetical protein
MVSDGPAGTLMKLRPPVGWADVRGEIAKAQLPKLYAANVASTIGVAGLVPAAAKPA